MKLLVLACILGAALAEERPPISLNYHEDIGIPEAARIKAAEEAMDFNGMRIVGGSQAALGQFPFLGGLLISVPGGTSVCGSSLLTNTRSVTAAHCVRMGNSNVNSVTVALGTIALFSGGTRLFSNNFDIHAGYNPNNLNNDIAIIIIPFVSFTNNIQPIARASGTNTFAGSMATASGYGRQSDTQGIGTGQMKHHVNNLQVITNAVCASTYGGNVVVASVICISTAGGRGTCGGDSGGPLETNVGGTRTLIGVTSFGHVQGCQFGHPAGFARVTSFAAWINQRL